MYYIKAPLINANEDTMTIVDWLHEKGTFTHKGETLCLLETAKSTLELQGETSGYFFPLVKAGQQVKVGQIIAALADQPNEEIKIPELVPPTLKPVPSSQRWTKKAELLANQYHIDLNNFVTDNPPNTIITEKDIRSYLAQSTETTTNKIDVNSGLATTRQINRIQRILILGGGNIAVLLMDILTRIPNQRAVGILDDDPNLKGIPIQGCTILGNIKDSIRLWNEGFFDAAILAIGVLSTRAKLYQDLSGQGILFTNVIDPTALILSDVEMGTGNVIMSFCRIGPQTIIGNNNFLSAYVNLEHHNILGDNCTFGPSVYTSGGVKMGSNIQLGTGIFIEPRLTIGDDVTIASGIILTADVPPHVIVKNKPNYSFHQKE